MKRINLLLTLVLLSAQFNLLSQNKESNFLRDYKAPNFKYRALNLYGFGGTRGTKATDNPYYHGYATKLNADLNFFSNQKKYQGNFYTNTNNDLFFSRADTLKSRRIKTFTNFRTQNYFYLKDEWFTSVNSYGRVSYEYNKNAPNELAYPLECGLIPNIGFGYGRMEPITFARRAWDIEKMLQKQNRLSADFSEEDRRMLADKIAQIESMRFYDFRLGNIYQMQALDSTLKQTGKVTKDDVLYYAQLMDAFYYGQRSIRYSGMRHEFNVQNQIYYQHSSDSSFFHQNGLRDLNLSYRFTLNKPQSYAIHHRYRAGANYTIDQSEYGVSQIYGSYRLIYAPNTRTELSAFGQGNLSYSEVGFGYNVRLNSNLYYYVSPRTRLTVSASINWQENHHTYTIFEASYLNVQNELFSYGLNVGINFAVF